MPYPADHALIYHASTVGNAEAKYASENIESVNSIQNHSSLQNCCQVSWRKTKPNLLWILQNTRSNYQRHALYKKYKVMTQS
jgi:hypothetical protein